MIRTLDDFLRRGWSAVLPMLAIALAAGLSSCDDDDDNGDPQPDQNVVELAQENANLSSLEAALTRFPDLVSTLSSTSSDFTVFAPTDEAFADFLEAIGQESLDNVPDDVLRNVLEYHVVAGNAVFSDELTAGDVTMVNGEEVSVDVSGGVTLNGSAEVTTADVEATNGVVHVIDEVLVPPSIAPIVGTIVAPAYFNKDFSVLVSAVVQAGLLETLLDATANYTLFAPTNDAFEAAGITALPPDTDEGNALLTAILLYHVLENEVAAAQLPSTGDFDPTMVEALGGTLYLTNRGSGVFLNGSTQVVATDIGATNGIVHVIDRTLVPPSQTIADIAIDFSDNATPEFTQLVAALSKVPALLDAADAEGNLTVLAPTDAAFEALYTAAGVDNLDELEAAIGNDKLAEVLQHHIIGARVFSTDLASNAAATLNQPVTFNVSNLTVTDATQNPANLVAGLLNVHATNGVIHVIDRVLIPEGIL